MVAGKLLVRARYPGTGSVRVLLVGRLMRRERSVARAATNTTRSVERVRRETAAIFFTSGGLGGLYHPQRRIGNRGTAGIVTSCITRMRRFLKAHPSMPCDSCALYFVPTKCT